MTFNNPVFYVAAPDYTELSSGRKVLHILCHELNQLGFESYITAGVTNPKLRTPKLDSNLITLHRIQKRMQIAIYPEIWMDNPLRVPFVIRWLLNKPNFFQKNWFGSFPKEESIWHFMPEFKPPWVDSDYVRLELIDRDLFNLHGVNNSERRGFIIYKNRIQGNENLPEWVDPIDFISIDNPKTPYECSQLYKKSRALILYERAASVSEAALCGCTIIAREHSSFDTGFIFDSFWKLSAVRDFNQNTVNIGQINAKIINEVYDLSVDAYMNRMKSSVIETIYKLKYNFSEDYFNRSLIIEDSLKNHMNKNFEHAIQGWRSLLAKDPSDLKIRYHLVDSLYSIHDNSYKNELKFLIDSVIDLNQFEWMNGLLSFLKIKFNI